MNLISKFVIFFMITTISCKSYVVKSRIDIKDPAVLQCIKMRIDYMNSRELKYTKEKYKSIVQYCYDHVRLLNSTN